MTASASTATAALHERLAHARDAHRRQRELVRASLVACPGARRALPASRSY
jgi:hypothetical protein